METELKSLEEKVHNLVRLYQDTCIENSKLRQQLADTNKRNEKLTEKIQIAANRLEILLSNMPDNE